MSHKFIHAESQKLVSIKSCIVVLIVSCIPRALMASTSNLSRALSRSRRVALSRACAYAHRRSAVANCSRESVRSTPNSARVCVSLSTLLSAVCFSHAKFSTISNNPAPSAVVKPLSTLLHSTMVPSASSTGSASTNVPLSISATMDSIIAHLGRSLGSCSNVARHSGQRRLSSNQGLFEQTWPHGKTRMRAWSSKVSVSCVMGHWIRLCSLTNVGRAAMVQHLYRQSLLVSCKISIFFNSTQLTFICKNRFCNLKNGIDWLRQACNVMSSKRTRYYKTVLKDYCGSIIYKFICENMPGVHVMASHFFLDQSRI